jgi:magnesium transporter
MHPPPQINTSNLERVRRIKNRMVRLTTRVETLREVLEKFLDDDSDMKDLNLTAKVC